VSAKAGCANRRSSNPIDWRNPIVADSAKPEKKYFTVPGIETFEKCSFLFKFKEGENFNHRNTFSILRIKI
jgi:hypothetical protein